MTKRIVVTGATGTIGSELVKQLKAQELDFGVAVRQPHRISDMHAVAFDYTKPDTFKNTLEGCHQLLLIVPPTRQSLVHIGDLMDVAYQCGVQHLIAITGMGAEALPSTASGIIDSHVRSGPIPWTILRPNWFMQNFYTYFGGDIVSQNRIYLPADDATTSFIDVRDVAEVAINVLRHHKYHEQAFTLTGPESLSHQAVAQVLAHHLKRSIVYHSPTDEDYAYSLRQQGCSEDIVCEMVSLFVNMRSGSTASISQESERIMGRPASHFHKFVQDHVSRWHA